MNKLTKLYSDILKSVNCFVNADGTIYLEGADGAKIMQVIGDNDNALVLPTSEVLRNGDWQNIAAFHPACESVFKGQSEVLNNLIGLMEVRLTETLQLTIATLADLSFNAKEHTGLNLRQGKLLTAIPEFNKTNITVLHRFIKRLAKVDASEGPQEISLQLKRDVAVGDTVVRRQCNLRSPMLEPGGLLDKHRGDKRSIEAIRELYDYILEPPISTVSNSDSPYFHAVVEAYVTLARRLAKIRTTLDKHKGIIPEINTSWYEDMANVDKWKKIYLPQTLPFNKGADDTDEQDVPPVAAVTNTATVPQAVLPVTEPKPVTTVTTGPKIKPIGVVRDGIVKAKSNVNTVTNGIVPQQPVLTERYQPPVQQYQQPIQQQPLYQQPVQQYQQPVQQQPLYQQPVQQYQQPVQQYQQPVQQPIQQQPLYQQPVQQYQQPVQQQQYQQPVQQRAPTRGDFR